MPVFGFSGDESYPAGLQEVLVTQPPGGRLGRREAVPEHGVRHTGGPAQHAQVSLRSESRPGPSYTNCDVMV